MTQAAGDSIHHLHLTTNLQIPPTNYPKEQAEAANYAFDLAVKQFLHDWVEQGTVPAKNLEWADNLEEFVDHGALRSFFKHRDDAFERLLEQESIARHLLRTIDNVYFQGDAYEPLLSRFERRIYNIAAQREHLEVPFRYSPPSRQSIHGDTLQQVDWPAGPAKEDIGVYFGTRRTDSTALSILAHQLRWEALGSSELPIYVIAEGYMEDSLQRVRTIARQIGESGEKRLQCFVIQRRHAADDRHLGASLLLMNPEQPSLPRRIIFCDTLKPGIHPPWWDKFKQKVDAVFPQPDGHEPASARLEDGGVKLQRLHDGVPVRHQDIDCAFYTAAIGRALIQLVKATPELILEGSIDAIVSQMTERMPEYYEQPNQPKVPVLVREANVVRRWDVGWQALKNLMQNKLTDLAAQLAPPAEQPVFLSLID